MHKTAVILAGGIGARLKSYTDHLPKPLLPIQDTPLLKILLDQLASYGYGRIILATHHQSDLIRDYCGDGSKWGLSIEYTQEKKPLGTIGPLKLISKLPENFLILNADVLTDLDFGEFYDQHVQRENLFTIAGYEHVEKLQYGALEIENQRLISFNEKPVIQQTVNMGIYAANRKILSSIPNQTFFGVNDLVAALLKAKLPIAVICHSGKWLDIGTPSNYHQAQTLAIP